MSKVKVTWWVFGVFCVRDNAVATRGRYLAFSKARWYCFTFLLPAEATAVLFSALRLMKFCTNVYLDNL